jgi:hypothetical protein
MAAKWRAMAAGGPGSKSYVTCAPCPQVASMVDRLTGLVETWLEEYVWTPTLVLWEVTVL